MLLFSSAALAEGPLVQPDMMVMASEITNLQKYMLTDADYTAKKNEAEIQKSFKSLEEHLGHLEKSFTNDPSLKANLGMLQQHIKDANRSFNEGGKNYSRFMLQSSLQMCITCHTRRKAADFTWVDVENKDMAPIDRADYYFVTRQFKKGVVVYESIVKDYPGKGAGQWNLRKALLALAVYYARVAEDPAEGAKYFRAAAQNPALPIYLQEEMKAWAEEFSQWAKEKPRDLGKATDFVILQRAKNILKKDDFSLVSEIGRSFHVRRLRASTLLQKVLESPGGKSPLKAEALLYLGQIYPRLSSNLFFRFGEMYLKACITEYPKTAMARSCYVALELNVTEGYSGSAGTDIPEDEQVELLRLKRIAY
jgi:hypothetical protein